MTFVLALVFSAVALALVNVDECSLGSAGRHRYVPVAPLC